MVIFEISFTMIKNIMLVIHKYYKSVPAVRRPSLIIKNYNQISIRTQYPFFFKDQSIII